MPHAALDAVSDRDGVATQTLRSTMTPMKKLLLTTATLSVAVSLAASLAGCGGNGDSSIPAATTTTASGTVPVGLWSGTATTSGASGAASGAAAAGTFQVDTLVLSDGHYVSFYGQTAGTLGMVSGKLTTTPPNFIDKSGVDLNLSLAAPVPSTTSGTFNATTLSGTEVADGQTLSFSLPVNADYAVTGSLTYLTGTWTSTTSQTGSFAFTANGSFTGTLASCSYSGSLAPTGTNNIYTGTITYLSTGCAAAAGTPVPIRGFITRNTLFFGGLDATNSFGVAFSGQK